MDRTGPRTVSSKKEIRYRRSAWRVHEFAVWSGGGEAVCRAGVVRLAGQLVVWVGAAGGGPRLGALALALAERGGGAACTALSGDAAAAGALARRLAAALRRPVLVCCGADFDRFSLPIVEQGLVAEIKAMPDMFDS